MTKELSYYYKIKPKHTLSTENIHVKLYTTHDLKVGVQLTLPMYDNMPPKEADEALEDLIAKLQEVKNKIKNESDSLAKFAASLG